jgi:hypothetical protein
MPRVISVSSANSLGTRLRKAAEPAESDLRMLQEFRAEYDPPMEEVESVLTNLSIQSTSRLKTPGTIIDKLIRDKSRLGKMQDIAGLRVVKDMRLDQQDRLVRRISNACSDSKPIDLRNKPSFGYRAVHVVAVVEGEFPVEIQVRTYMQDLWAQMIEGLEGELGRGIRYGRPPLHPRRVTPAGPRLKGIRRPTQAQMVASMKVMAEFVEAVEVGRLAVHEGYPQANTREFKRRLSKAEKELRSLCERALEGMAKVKKGATL